MERIVWGIRELLGDLLSAEICLIEKKYAVEVETRALPLLGLGLLVLAETMEPAMRPGMASGIWPVLARQAGYRLVKR